MSLLGIHLTFIFIHESQTGDRLEIQMELLYIESSDADPGWLKRKRITR